MINKKKYKVNNLIFYLKFILKKILPRFLIILLYQIENFIILSIKYGQFKSIIKKSSIDRLGNPIPWYSYPAIEFLDQFDFSQTKIIEYGSGNSTIWWAKRCKEIISIEHDEKYFKVASCKNLKNLKLRLFTKKNNYINQNELTSSDIIIIDGNFRKDIIVNLIKNCYKIKKNNTLIIIDNSHWYSEIIKKVQKKLNYTQIDFFGFCPSVNFTNATTLLINKNKKFFYRNKKISFIGATYI
jgi:hypothetical protein